MLADFDQRLRLENEPTGHFIIDVCIVGVGSVSEPITVLDTNSHEAEIAISAIEFKGIPIVAFRRGPDGLCEVRVNPRSVLIKTIKIIDRGFDDPLEIEVEHKRQYQPLFLNSQQELVIEGKFGLGLRRKRALKAGVHFVKE